MDRKPCNNGFYFMDSYLYKPVTMVSISKENRSHNSLTLNGLKGKNISKEFKTSPVSA